jgi:fermentation-respiration switch protein FrsA (DUF1100 family)
MDAAIPGEDAATPGPDASGTALDAATALDPFTPPDRAIDHWEGTLPSGKTIGVYAPPKGGPSPLPLVVFAHGFLLGIDDYNGTVQHLAKYGYVVATVDYPESIVSFDHHDAVKALEDGIDAAIQSQLGDRIDTSKVVVMGHSVGGKAAVWAAAEDSRFKAVVALDPVDDDPSPIKDPKKHPSVTPEMMANLKVPALYFGAEISATDSCSPTTGNACRFREATTSSPAFLLVLKNFGHMQFLDNSGCLLCSQCKKGVTGNDELKWQTDFRGLIVAFLELTQRGNLAYQTYLSGAQLQALQQAGVVMNDGEQTAFCAK